MDETVVYGENRQGVRQLKRWLNSYRPRESEDVNGMDDQHISRKRTTIFDSGFGDHDRYFACFFIIIFSLIVFIFVSVKFLFQTFIFKSKVFGFFAVVNMVILKLLMSICIFYSLNIELLNITRSWVSLLDIKFNKSHKN